MHIQLYDNVFESQIIDVFACSKHFDNTIVFFVPVLDTDDFGGDSYYNLTSYVKDNNIEYTEKDTSNIFDKPSVCISIDGNVFNYFHVREIKELF